MLFVCCIAEKICRKPRYKVYIYGTGYWGSYYKRLLSDNDIDTNGFLVSDLEEITKEKVYYLGKIQSTESREGIFDCRKVFDILAPEWKNKMDHIMIIA